jgi:hypothetical protein
VLENATIAGATALLVMLCAAVHVASREISFRSPEFGAKILDCAFGLSFQGVFGARPQCALCSAAPHGFSVTKKTPLQASYRLAGPRFSTFFGAHPKLLQNGFMVKLGNQQALNPYRGVS